MNTAEQKFTPGPWKFDNPKDDCRRIVAGDGSSLMGDQRYYPWCPDHDADWKLIASAPELLEALQLAKTTFFDNDGGLCMECGETLGLKPEICPTCKSFAKIESAIRKATEGA